MKEVAGEEAVLPVPVRTGMLDPGWGREVFLQLEYRVFHGVFHGDEELHGLFPVHQAVKVQNGRQRMYGTSWAEW